MTYITDGLMMNHAAYTVGRPRQLTAQVIANAPHSAHVASKYAMTLITSVLDRISSMTSQLRCTLLVVTTLLISVIPIWPGHSCSTTV
jgi:hypothetical protein